MIYRQVHYDSLKLVNVQCFKRDGGNHAHE